MPPEIQEIKENPIAFIESFDTATGDFGRLGLAVDFLSANSLTLSSEQADAIIAKLQVTEHDDATHLIYEIKHRTKVEG